MAAIKRDALQNGHISECIVAAVLTSFLSIIRRKIGSDFWLKCSRLFTIHLIALGCKTRLSFDARE